MILIVYCYGFYEIKFACPDPSSVWRLLFHIIFSGRSRQIYAVTYNSFLPELFSFGLARVPQDSFQGSLIPLQSLGDGRNAIQSASRGDLVVQCWPDYKVANRLVYSDAELPSEFLRQHAHLSSNIRGKERRNGICYPSRATYSHNLFRDIFYWREVNPIDDLSLLYRVPKACIWLKLSPPIFFQLFI